MFDVFDFANFDGFNTNYGSYQLDDSGNVIVVRALDNEGNLLGTPTSVINDPRRFGAPRRCQLGMRYQF